MLALYLLTSLLFLAGRTKGECPTGWTDKSTNGCYRLFDDAYKAPTTWWKAATFCMAQGGYLAEIQSQEQNDIVGEVRNGKEVWLGLRPRNYGPWEWSDLDKDLGYINWDDATKEPLNTDKDICVYMNTGHKWFTTTPADCDQLKKSVLCQKKQYGTAQSTGK